ncbi:MAG: phosphoribosyltransferase [Nanoarchaeota archaeon]|nr:phosphoribosyltransferase [Nanoarchaeota archaeon]
MKKNIKRLNINLDTSIKISKQLGKIILKKYKADIVVTIPEGGILPANEISKILKIPFFKIDVKRKINFKHIYQMIPKKLHFIVRPIHRIAFRIRTPELMNTLNFNCRNKKILIIDDATETGKTLKVTKNILKKMGSKEIKVATLSYLNGEKPDFFINRNLLKFPWSKDSLDYKKFLTYCNNINKL